MEPAAGLGRNRNETTLATEGRHASWAREGYGPAHLPQRAVAVRDVDLLTDVAGTEARRRYYRPYLDLAQKVRAGFVPGGRTWGTSAE